MDGRTRRFFPAAHRSLAVLVAGLTAGMALAGCAPKRVIQTGDAPYATPTPAPAAVDTTLPDYPGLDLPGPEPRGLAVTFDLPVASD